MYVLYVYIYIYMRIHVFFGLKIVTVGLPKRIPFEAT